MWIMWLIAIVDFCNLTKATTVKGIDEWLQELADLLISRGRIISLLLNGITVGANQPRPHGPIVIGPVS